MSSLSSYIVDPVTGKRLTWKSFEEAGLYKTEKELDKLVIDQSELLADLLIENQLMEDGSNLKFLGQQFHNVDILFAEVDSEGEPGRLVLVEDKLLKNPESKRKVIGQIIDYAARFTTLVRAQEMAEYFLEHKDWIEENAEVLDRQLEMGNFLLVICGDGIQSNVADIVGRLAHRADRHPTSGMELCLVALDLYTDDKQHFLVPHLVGRVVRAERVLQINVQVKGPHGEPVSVRVETTEGKLTQGPAVSKPNLRPDEFMPNVWAKQFGKESVERWNRFVSDIMDAEIPGLTIGVTPRGRPRLQLRSVLLDRIVPVLVVRRSQPAVKDEMTAKFWLQKEAMEARDQFRQTLLAVSGITKTQANSISIPIALLGAATPAAIEAMRRLAEAIDSR